MNSCLRKMLGSPLSRGLDMASTSRRSLEKWRWRAAGITPRHMFTESPAMGGIRAAYCHVSASRHRGLTMQHCGGKERGVRLEDEKDEVSSNAISITVRAVLCASV